MAHVRFGEVVESQSGNYVEMLCRVPVKLPESIGGMHRIITALLELVRHQVVPQIVSSDRQRIFIVESIIVKGAYAMLHIAVVADIIFVRYQIVALVILVECISQLQIAFRVEVIIPFQTATESAIAFLISEEASVRGNNNRHVPSAVAVRSG